MSEVLPGRFRPGKRELVLNSGFGPIKRPGSYMLPGLILKFFYSIILVSILNTDFWLLTSPVISSSTSAGTYTLHR
jgi:hypothetical protein